MFGAAAEITVLSLLEAIKDATRDPATKRRLTQMLESGRLPAIFQTITYPTAIPMGFISNHQTTAIFQTTTYTIIMPMVSIFVPHKTAMRQITL